jgi:6-phosphogluconolactonase
MLTQSRLYLWDERREIAIPGDFQTTVLFAAEHFITTANNAIKHHNKFFVALTGGSSPKPIYALLASPTYRDKIPWEKVYLFWVDERSVPPDHEESNYRMAMEAGFKNLPVPKNQIFRMVAEENIELNARYYEERIKQVLEGTPFDLILLGMGTDGHTASLFPRSEGIYEERKWVIANFIPEKNTWRMTFTLPLINAANHIVFYVFGKDKADTLMHVLKEKRINSSALPASRVGTKKHRALWIIDKDAATLLLEHLKK